MLPSNVRSSIRSVYKQERLRKYKLEFSVFFVHYCKIGEKTGSQKVLHAGVETESMYKKAAK